MSMMPLVLPDHFETLTHEQQLVWYRNQAERAQARAQRQHATIERMKKARDKPRTVYVQPKPLPLPDWAQIEMFVGMSLPGALERLHAISAAVHEQLAA